MTSRVNVGPASALALSAALATAAGCSSAQPQPPIATAETVDLGRFMGDWYVIANIPTFVEKDAYNAVETYAPGADNTIATTFSFRKGGFDGKRKTYHPTGFVREESGNAVWGMQFIWPFKAEYRVIYINDDYTQTHHRAQQARLRLDHGARTRDLERGFLPAREVPARAGLRYGATAAGTATLAGGCQRHLSGRPAILARH